MDTITVQCPSCGHSLRFGADKAGRKAKCPKCGNTVPIPAADAPPPVVAAAPPPPPPADDDDGPANYGLVEETGKRMETDVIGKREPKAQKKNLPKLTRRTKTLADKEQWEKVQTGLMFLFVGVVIWLAVHLLHGLYVVLGNIDFAEFAKI